MRMIWLDHAELQKHRAVIKTFEPGTIAIFEDLVNMNFTREVCKVTSILRIGDVVLLESKEISGEPLTTELPTDTVIYFGFAENQQGKTLAEVLEDGVSYRIHHVDEVSEIVPCS